MRRVIAAVALALAVAGVGLASHTARSDAPTDASWMYQLLPYVEQDNVFKIM